MMLALYHQWNERAIVRRWSPLQWREYQRQMWTYRAYYDAVVVSGGTC